MFHTIHKYIYKYSKSTYLFLRIIYFFFHLQKYEMDLLCKDNLIQSLQREALAQQDMIYNLQQEVSHHYI